MARLPTAARSPRKYLSEPAGKRSRRSIFFPAGADEHQLAADGALGAAQPLADLGGGVFLQPQPGDLPQLLAGQLRQQRLEVLGEADGELRGRLGADDLVEREVLGGG